MDMGATVGWSDMKTFLDQRKLICQWISLNNSYRIFANDSGFTLGCVLPQDGSASADVTDFETNYKPGGNKSPAQSLTVGSSPPFASKTWGLKSLFKRITGQKFSLVVGSNNNLIYLATFPQIKFTGIEIVNGEIGDTVSLYVLDTATGTYSTFPNAVLNQFGYAVNVAERFSAHKSEFDADIYAGMQIKVVYTSMSVKTIGLNYIMNELK